MQPIPAQMSLFPVVSTPKAYKEVAKKAEMDGRVLKVTAYIWEKLDLSIDQFEAFWSQLGINDITLGNNCRVTALHVAAYVGNLPLIAHLAKTPQLIHLASETGMTPIFWAAMCIDPQRAFAATKLLIDLGAEVTVMTKMASNSPWGEVFEEESVLWQVAEKTNNLKLILLLLVNGGAIYQPFSDRGRANVMQAIQQLFDNIQPFFEAWNFNPVVHMLPKEIIGLIVATHTYVHFA